MSLAKVGNGIKEGNLPQDKTEHMRVCNIPPRGIGTALDGRFLHAGRASHDNDIGPVLRPIDSQVLRAGRGSFK